MKKNGLTQLAASALMLLSFNGWASYLDNQLTTEFIDRLVSQHQFERNDLETLFKSAEKKQSIIDAMNRPAEKTKPWYQYRKHFINEKRINLGVEFWRENHETLNRAYQQYGVNPEIIVAIIGVETYYGRNMGSFRVIDALSTLSFDYPRRSEFFTKQLEHFLLLAREQNKAPMDLKGSYAGAMGYGQFIPSSYRAYAVDFDNDNIVDIWNNPVDAIGSVANYFSEHGWKANGKVVLPATASQQNIDFNKLSLKTSLGELAKQGISAPGNTPKDTPAIAIKLELEKGQEYWLGLPNFYTITRYNHSHLYAMAVYQLSETIKERVGSAQ